MSRKQLFRAAVAASNRKQRKPSTVPKPPLALETAYAAKITAMAQRLNKRIVAMLDERLPLLIAQRDRELSLDSFSDELERFIALLFAIGQEEAQALIAELPALAAVAAKQNKLQKGRQLKQITGINPLPETRAAGVVLETEVTLAETLALRSARPVTLPSGLLETLRTAPPVGPVSASQQNLNLLAVDVFRENPKLVPLVESWAAENAQLIKDVADSQVKAVEGITQRGLRGGLSQKQIADEIADTLGVNNNATGKRKIKNRAKLIAADQLGTLNGNLTMQTDLDLGITEYKWSTSLDERVRPAIGLKGTKTKRKSQKANSATNPSHRALQGKICRWDDPTVYRNEGETVWRKRSEIGAELKHPGMAIRCRCTSYSVIPDWD